jgi:cytochrome P450
VPSPSPEAPSRPKRPRGPKGHWLLGSILELQKDPLRLLSQGFAEYGEVISYRMGPIRVTYFTHPDHVRHILVERPTLYGRSKLLRRTEPILGKGLITNDGESWRRQRRLAQPAFHRERLAVLVDQMTQVMHSHLRQWDSLPEGTVLDVMPAMTRLTLSITTRTLFSSDAFNRIVNPEAAALETAMNSATHENSARVLSVNPLRMFLPTRANREFARNMQQLNNAVFGLIEARRKDPHPPQDLLQMLLEARDEDTGGGMSDQQLRDELMTLIVAGHETTTFALGWTWFLLGSHPEVWAKLQAEVDSVLGDRTPTAQDLPKLRYTAMVIDESMRLYPPVWSFPREALQDDVIGGYQVSKGDIITLSPYLTHRHPAVWEEPERFDPERFTPERSSGRPRLAFFPFGGGMRMCIGTNFASMEMQLILAMIVQRYRAQYAAEKPPPFVVGINLRPDAVPLRLHRRVPSALRAAP